MSGAAPLATPSCCALGARNLEWFPRSPPAGAWHPSSFRWNPRRDAPTSDPVARCPFCGQALPSLPPPPEDSA